MTVDELKEILAYDPVTGVISWRVNRSNQIRAGMQAGSINKQGYRYIEIEHRSYRSNRVAWALFYDEWPTEIVDHKNRNKQDDSINNLRLATKKQNNVNAGLRKDNKSGYKGVSFCKKTNKFRAAIINNGEQLTLGYFTNAFDASEAYNKKAIELFGGFTT